MIITIDGPAGAGKSTAARHLASRLGFEFLDTGAMYRAVTLKALEQGVDRASEAALAMLLERTELRMPGGQVILDGKDVSAAIRRPEVTEASKAIADSPAVRSHLAKLQRELAQGRNIVCEGRDQGTIVFPKAECKFFLTADPAERARRRHHELLERGASISLDDVRHSQEARDQRDTRRTIAPMIPAPDAVLLDTTHLTLEQVLERMEQEVRRCQAGSKGSSSESATRSATLS
jgi:cytidylate kinase